jgi:hypothetical protein
MRINREEYSKEKSIFPQPEAGASKRDSRAQRKE